MSGTTGSGVDAPSMQVLWPQGGASGSVVEPGDHVRRLAGLYAYPDSGCWVRANMVATLDGAAAGQDGRTGSINSPADHAVFHLLRGLADVILVGAGTVRAEHYRLPKPYPALAEQRRSLEQAPTPLLAVVTRSGDVPDELAPSTDGSEDRHGVLVITAESAGSEVLNRLHDRFGPKNVLVAGAERVDLTVAVDALADMGLERVLCEGGPSVLGELVAGGELDELCLTWSPIVTGGFEPRILRGLPAEQRFDLAHLLHSDGTLIGRWVRR
ncbi:MAG TPA: pyrimidine reductase family protein [Actinomycetales bacterium]|nr:pyrimidine reductase family protein [Actinomycetales bacterium]